MSAEYMRMLQNMPARSNRTLEDLINSNDQLFGMDGMELRGWASQNPMVPGRHLNDPLGQSLLAVYQGRLDVLQTYVDQCIADSGDRDAVAQELYNTRWGPTRIGIYNVILTFVHRVPKNKEQLLELTRYLAQHVKVSVDMTDVIGSSALYWAISTKPFAEPEFAQILFDAGGSVNQKNRFGCNASSEIGQADVRGDTSKNVQMMEWFVEHGGDVEAKDNDGMSAKKLVDMMSMRVPALAEVLRKGRGARHEGDCENCGRSPTAEKAFSACAKCKSKRYCSQPCQRVDWRTHKKSCTAVA